MVFPEPFTTGRAYQLLPRSLSLEDIIETNGRAEVAAMMFMIWDTVIHASDEVEYIWKGPNTWVTYVYIYVRHVPTIAQAVLVTIATSSSTGVEFSGHECKAWATIQGVVMVSTIFAVELILVARVYVIYSRSRIVLRMLLILFLGEVGAMLMSASNTVLELQFTAHCTAIAAPSIFMASWLSSLAFESILFVLTLLRFVRVIQRGKGVVYTFIRDGIWAFALLFVIFLINTLMYQLDAPSAGACYAWALAIVSFTGSHVLLNLRQLVTTPHVPTGYSRSTIFSANHEIRFRHTVSRTGSRLEEAADYDELLMVDIHEMSQG